MGEVLSGPFPWGSKLPKPEVNVTVTFDDNDVVDLVTENISEFVFDMMHDAGFDNQDDPQYTKDLTLICESIRSYLLKLQETYHPFQDVAQNVFEWDDEGMIIMPTVNVTFKYEDEL